MTDNALTLRGEVVALGISEFKIIVDPSELFGQGGGARVLLCDHSPAAAFELIDRVSDDFAERNQPE